MGQGFESLMRGQIQQHGPDGEIGRHKRLKISRFNEHAGSIPAPGTMNTMLEPRRPPNPFDPYDDVKRWYDQLWPIERLGVWLCSAVIILLLLMWVTN